MIAALYVLPDGPYARRPNVEVWDEARDARQYAGPWPVVAHPPCSRWGRYWSGGPTWIASGRPRKVLGDDDGCFAAALAAVRRWGGVLEHPADSHAWTRFGVLAPPQDGGWIVADWEGGWTCCVSQGHYGHRGKKATWLYACRTTLPSLQWGPCRGERWARVDRSCRSAEERRRAVRTGVCQILSHRQRALTPVPFAEVLLSMARSVR